MTWLFRDLFYPMSFGYNYAVPKPARRMVNNGGHNLSLSGEALQQLLRGQVAGRVDGDGAFRCELHGRARRPCLIRQRIGRSDVPTGISAKRWASGVRGRGFI